MTSAQRRALGAYIREIADILGLVEWKLFLDAEQPQGTDGASGHCHVIFGHKAARIWVEDLTREPADWQRYVVVHELLHIPLQAPWWVWSRPVEDLVARPTFDAIATNAVTTWEDTVDHLARAIGPLLPHPDWDADPDVGWIGDVDDEGTLVLYSRTYHEAGHHRPLS